MMADEINNKSKQALERLLNAATSSAQTANIHKFDYFVQSNIAEQQGIERRMATEYAANEVLLKPFVK
ncbi:hypothetical protein C2869_21335 [Saccharobesus litoralis]|uniref:Uncharacterized protein n=1 Tax=Saccharobesus litoralis TaxID=2172099 RepID=A0A2S0VX79_9ALTE|nr:hypothetical protein [Saccharobesus litoralis]AWB68785.1 hypothetical protein C2869_21335 [Saccharobesus litoralis]